MHHHYRSLGGWTFAFTDYIALNITGDVDEPNTQKMFSIIDPLCMWKKTTVYITISFLFQLMLNNWLIFLSLLSPLEGMSFFCPTTLTIFGIY